MTLIDILATQNLLSNEGIINQYIKSNSREVKMFNQKGLLPIHLLCINNDPIPLKTLSLLLELFPLSTVIKFKVSHILKLGRTIEGTYNIAEFLYILKDQDAFDIIWNSSGGRHIRGYFINKWNCLDCWCPSIVGNSQAHDICPHFVELQMLLNRNPSQVWIINDSNRTPFETALKFHGNDKVLRILLITMRKEAIDFDFSDSTFEESYSFRQGAPVM